MALVVAPLTTVVARTLNVPWDDQHPTWMVNDIAAAPLRSDIGASLVVLGGMLSVVAVLYLAVLARRQRPRLGGAGGVLAGIGSTGLVAVGAKSLCAGQVVGHSPHDTAVYVLQHLSLDLYTVDLLVTNGMAGYLLLAMCLFGIVEIRAYRRSSSAPAAWRR